MELSFSQKERIARFASPIRNRERVVVHVCTVSGDGWYVGLQEQYGNVLIWNPQAIAKGDLEYTKAIASAVTVYLNELYTGRESK